MYVDLQFFPTGMQQAKLQSSVNLSFFRDELSIYRF